MMAYTGFTETREVVYEDVAYFAKKIDEERDGRNIYNIFVLQERLEPENMQGLHRINKYRKLHWKQLTAWIRSDMREPFKVLGHLCTLLKTTAESFEFILVLGDISLVTKYAKTYEYENFLQTVRANPANLDKLERAKTHIMTHITSFRNLCEEHFRSRPHLLYLMTPLIFGYYMKKYGTFEETQLGMKIARHGWLSIPHTEIIAPIHEAHWKNKWQQTLLRFTCAGKSLPSEVCELVASYIVKVKAGETIAQFVARISDNGFVKPKHASICNIERSLEFGDPGINVVYTIKLKQYKF